jgi:hypothetical protein
MLTYEVGPASYAAVRAGEGGLCLSSRLKAEPAGRSNDAMSRIRDVDDTVLKREKSQRMTPFCDYETTV